MDEEDLQYGPWLRVIGPKAIKSKTPFSQPNTDEASDEENLETEGNDGDRDQSPSCPQVLHLLPVRTLNLQAANSELDVPPRISENQVSSKLQNQILNLKPGSAAVPTSFSNSKLALIEIQPSHDSKKSIITNGGVLGNNCSKENVEFRFYPTPKGFDKSSESQTKDKEQKSSLGDIQTPLAELGTTDLSGVFSNYDMEMDISPNLAEDYPNEKIRSLHSWKRILRHPNTFSPSEAHETPLNHIKCALTDCP